MYISRQIVELHGGEIGAEFPADGGTRFVVRLPIGSDESEALRPRSWARDGATADEDESGEQVCAGKTARPRVADRVRTTGGRRPEGARGPCATVPRCRRPTACT
ncbi:MAG TPA: hypothetical protein VGM69_10610 [Chloroflexota bacterium]